MVVNLHQNSNFFEIIEKLPLETLRKYPVIPNLRRIVTKNYKLPNGSTVPKGTSVIIPTFAFHHDPGE